MTGMGMGLGLGGAASSILGQIDLPPTVVSLATVPTSTVSATDLSNGGKSITISGGTAYDGTYTVTQPDTARLKVGNAGATAYAPVAPTASGTGALGETLTATAGLWLYDSTIADFAVAGQWHSDGVAIAGATALTFTLTASEQGTSVTYREASTGTGYAANTSESNAIAVAAADTTAPTISSITFDGTDTLSFSVSEGATVYYLADDNATRTQAQTKTGGGLASGSFPVTAPSETVVIDFSAVPAGDHSLHLMAEDAAGNKSAVSSAIYTFAGSVPSAFAVGDWSIADATSGGTLTVSITSLPAAGSDTITDIERTVDAGTTWVSTGGTGGFNITGLTDDVSQNVQIRAVSAAGSGAASDVKAATPTTAAAGAGITPIFLSGVVSGNTAGGGGDDVTLDMSTHNGTDDVLLMMGAMGNGGISITDVTLDGNVNTALVTQTNASADGPLTAYAIIPAAAFAASSICSVSYSGFGKDVGVAAFAIPAGSTVAIITSQPDTVRDGCDLSGNVSAGSGVLACQLVKNGAGAAWTGVTEVYEADVRSNEWFSVASLGNVAGGAPMTITSTSGVTETAGISVQVS